MHAEGCTLKRIYPYLSARYCYRLNDAFTRRLHITHFFESNSAAAKHHPIIRFTSWHVLFSIFGFIGCIGAEFRWWVGQQTCGLAHTRPDQIQHIYRCVLGHVSTKMKRLAARVWMIPWPPTAVCRRLWGYVWGYLVIHSLQQPLHSNSRAAQFRSQLTQNFSVIWCVNKP